ncbi:MAG TPA: DUF5953 family protein [Archangium sp.]|jgi:hypothetical protein|uniref:DUF5953 family protein n=1 Tax=Archangium sp. TaxID=1872627 RepID=UPI002ED81C09
MPTAHRNHLCITVYAPALNGDDGRPVAIVHEMERAIPGLCLGWMIPEEGQRLPLRDRDAWLAHQRMDGGFPLLRNDDDNFRVTVTGWESPASSSPGGRAHFVVDAALPLTADGIAASADVLEAVAQAARALWGHATPFSAAVDIARQTKNWAANPKPPPRGLPALLLPEKIRSPENPHRLGWLNYWSDAAARTIGFPDPARDAELLSRSRRTATGGWVVRLTDTPLDMDNPAHLDALERAYERFPEIGGRSTP